MLYLPFRKSLSCINTSATLIAGTWGKHLNKQHVPQWLRQQLTSPRRSQPHRSYKRNDTKPDCDCAIGQHLSENEQCALKCDNMRFSILATARSFSCLNLFEAVYIKTQHPVFCREKEFVYSLKLS